MGNSSVSSLLRLLRRVLRFPWNCSIARLGSFAGMPFEPMYPVDSSEKGLGFILQFLAGSSGRACQCLQLARPEPGIRTLATKPLVNVDMDT